MSATRALRSAFWRELGAGSFALVWCGTLGRKWLPVAVLAQLLLLLLSTWLFPGGTAAPDPETLRQRLTLDVTAVSRRCC